MRYKIIILKRDVGAVVLEAMVIRVSQIAGVFQKIIFKSCTLLHIIPFAKLIGPVEKKIANSEFSPIFS